MFQILSIGISAIINSTFDTITAAFICIGSIQFDVLKSNFQTLTSSNEKQGNVDDKIIEQRIKKFVKWHIDIMDYLALVEDTFSNGVFVQFMGSVIIICMSGFRLVVVSASQQTLSMYI